MVVDFIQVMKFWHINVLSIQFWHIYYALSIQVLYHVKVCHVHCNNFFVNLNQCQFMNLGVLHRGLQQSLVRALYRATDKSPWVLNAETIYCTLSYFVARDLIIYQRL